MNDDARTRSAQSWVLAAVILGLVLIAAAWMNSSPTAGSAAPQRTPTVTAAPPQALPAAPAPALADAPAPPAAQIPAAVVSKPSLPGAKAPDLPSTDCKALVQAHAQASRTCAGQAEAAACVRQTLQNQGLNADAYDLCKLFKPGAP